MFFRRQFELCFQLARKILLIHQVGVLQLPLVSDYRELHSILHLLVHWFLQASNIIPLILIESDRFCAAVLNNSLLRLRDEMHS